MARETRRTTLTPADGAWWWMEHPTNLMTITGVFTFAEPFDGAAVRGLFASPLFERIAMRLAAASMPALERETTAAPFGEHSAERTTSEER